MVRTLLFALLGCVASAANAGNCRGGACRDVDFGRDANGCMELRNAGREDIEVTVYTGTSGPITVHLMTGTTEKVFKAGRMCVLAADYVRSDAKYAGGTFTPSR